MLGYGGFGGQPVFDPTRQFDVGYGGFGPTVFDPDRMLGYGGFGGQPVFDPTRQFGVGYGGLGMTQFDPTSQFGAGYGGFSGPPVIVDNTLFDRDEGTGVPTRTLEELLGIDLEIDRDEGEGVPELFGDFRIDRDEGPGSVPAITQEEIDNIRSGLASLTSIFRDEGEGGVPAITQEEIHSIRSGLASITSIFREEGPGGVPAITQEEIDSIRSGLGTNILREERAFDLADPEIFQFLTEEDVRNPAVLALLRSGVEPVDIREVLRRSPGLGTNILGNSTELPGM
jgi:hypothetical protein